jgi:hypothetical protein
MVGDVLRRMRCSGACGGRAGAAWMVTGPVLNASVRPRRVARLGPNARSSVHHDLIGEPMGRRLLEIVVYGRCCRIGVRGFSGLADRPGRYADAHHGGVGSGLTFKRRTSHGFLGRAVKPEQAG